jgi:hypothetical protein
MRNSVAKVVRLSALVGAGGALSFAVFFANCGGESGQRTGSAGTSGSGVAGTTGTGGAAGTGGRVACPTDAVLNCSTAITLGGGHVITFSPDEWSPTDGKYCNASGLRGSVFSYSGPTVDGGNLSSNSHGVDAAAGNFRLTLMASSAGYAGGGVSFDRCVTAAASTGIRYTVSLAPGGDQMNCTFKLQLQTFEQRPTNQSPGGGCDPAGSCYGFPASPSVTLTETPQTITVPWANFTTGATHAAPFMGQIVGLQWQLESGAPLEDGGAQTACSVEVRVDDIDFI